MDLPVSSGNKEGLRARIEGVERIEAADEGLGVTRGMLRESDVECIQSQTWRAVRGRRADARVSGRRFVFPFTLAWTRPLSQYGRLCDKTATHKTRPLEATTRLGAITYNAAQSLHHVLSTHPFEC